jgi:hypothetical protein
MILIFFVFFLVSLLAKFFPVFSFLFLFHFSTTSTRTLEFSHHGSFIGFLHLSFSRDFFAMEADRVREIPDLNLPLEETNPENPIKTPFI